MPTAPANGASVTVPLTISWSAVTDPSGILAYNWQVSVSSTMTPVVQLDSTMGETQDTVSGLANGTYFWRVQAVSNDFVTGAWSSPRSFTVTGVGPGEPGTPTLSQPKGGTQFHPFESITFTWSPVPGAASYVFEADKNASFPVVSTRVHFDNIPTTTYSIVIGDFCGGCEQGNYLARVYAVGANGNRGVPSATVGFSVFYNNPLPAAPTPLAPVNGAVVGLPLTLSWTEVPNPQDGGYEVQIARDSSFSSIEDDIPFITPPNREVLSLTSGTKFWRVRSFQGDNSQNTAAVTAWSKTASFVISSATPKVASVSFTRTAPFSGDDELGQVQLTGAAPPGGALVTLTSSNPSAMPVPASVTVAAGVATLFAPFQTRAGQVTAPTPVTVTATFAGSSASVTLTVQPPALQQIWAPSTATGGTAIGAIVYLNGIAPPGGAVVSLSSSSSAAQVPATVTVQSGQPTVQVLIPTSAVGSTTAVTITASWHGVSSQTQVTLTPQQQPASITLSPTTTTGTNGSSGTVTIAAPASTDLQLPLTSSDTTLATVDAAVTIPAGSTTGGFLVFTRTPPATTRTVVISVTGGGVTRSATLTVNPFPSATLAAPQLLTPAQDTRFRPGDLVRFDWSDVAGAASYTIQVSTSSAFSTLALNQVVSTSQLATASLPTARLFWRVRAVDGGGGTGSWSVVRGFRIN